MQEWVLYILQCRDGSYYTGVTADLQMRVRAHKAGRGAKYTASRLPVSLVCSVASPVLDQGGALSLEARVKRLTRAQKEEFMQGEGPLFAEIQRRLAPIMLRVFARRREEP